MNWTNEKMLHLDTTVGSIARADFSLTHSHQEVVKQTYFKEIQVCDPPLQMPSIWGI